MGLRTAAMEVLEAVVWIADVLSFSISDEDNDVLAEVSPEAEGGQPIADVQVFGIAGVQSRPKDGSEDDGYPKALRVQLADYSLVIATHDPRHVEIAEPGELVIHALGLDGDLRALVRLKPDGSIDVSGTQVIIGNPDGTLHPIPLGDMIETHFDDVKSYVDAHTHEFPHTHTHPMGPTGTPTPTATLAPSSASPSVPTLTSSKHLVEE
jgi:hypothetical protein